MTAEDAPEPEDLEGKVIRLRQGFQVHEMSVKEVHGPWITGEIRDDQGNPRAVTMDLRTTTDIQIRHVSKGAKAAWITAGSVTGAGILAGIIAAVLVSWSSSLSYP